MTKTWGALGDVTSAGTGGLAEVAAERWLPVPGFPDYEVSDLGSVRSWSRRSHGRLLKPAVQATGVPYLFVQVRDASRKQYRRAIHRLVGEAFIGPLPAGLQTRHLNSDPQDNRLTNLAYGTPAENTHDTILAGHHPTWGHRLTRCGRGHSLADAYWSNGGRTCRTCRRLRYIAKRDGLKLEAAA